MFSEENQKAKLVGPQSLATFGMASLFAAKNLFELVHFPRKKWSSKFPSKQHYFKMEMQYRDIVMLVLSFQCDLQFKRLATNVSTHFQV